MTEGRKSIDRLAAILSYQFEEAKQTASRMEKVVKTPLKIDDKGLKQTLDGFVIHVNSVKKENQKRLPNWISGGFFFMLLITFVFAFIAVSKLKAPDTIKIETQGQIIELGHDEVKYLHDFYLEHKEK